MCKGKGGGEAVVDVADGAMCSATKAHVRLHVGVAYIHIVNCIGLGLGRCCGSDKGMGKGRRGSARGEGRGIADTSALFFVNAYLMD